MKALLVCMMLIVAVIANAEDDYTLKDWCKPFRPRVCYDMVFAADEGLRFKAK